MLTVTDEIYSLLCSHQKGRTYGVAQYQGTSVRLGLGSGSVTVRADGEVQASGDVHVVGVSNSLVPRTKVDPLAPYGQEVALYRELLGPDDTVLATIPLGVFRITGNSGGRETVREYGPSFSLVGDQFVEVAPGVWSNASLVESPVGSGLFGVGGLVESPAGSGLYSFRMQATAPLRSIVLDWEVEVELADRFRMLQRAKLLDPKSPVPGNTMYDEIRRLSLFPVEESLTDEAVPAGMVYDDRMSAIRALAGLADGVPTLTRQGVLTLRLKDPVGSGHAEVFDISGTIDWQEGQSDEFYNYVWAHSDNKEFNGFAGIFDDSNPLSVSRAGPVTYEHSSPLYTTDASARAGAETVLARLQRRSRTVSVKCLPVALLLELGDVGWVRDPVQGRDVFGEVVGLRFPVDPTEPVEVDLLVPEES